jgi:uncharacterized protein (DUF3084 family)
MSNLSIGISRGRSILRNITNLSDRELEARKKTLQEKKSALTKHLVAQKSWHKQELETKNQELQTKNQRIQTQGQALQTKNQQIQQLLEMLPPEARSKFLAEQQGKENVNGSK